MRKYYLFIIKKEFRNVYKLNAQILYFTLENIYQLKNDYFVYGISIYNQLCNVFDTEIVSNYLIKKNKKYIKKHGNTFYVNDIYAGEKSCLQVNHSCIVLKTHCNLPYIMQIFKWYNDNIFVCDFENKDYFWLSDKVTKLPNYAYHL